MTLKNRCYQYKAIHRGLQYCLKVYQAKLSKNNMLASRTDGYDRYQNALDEHIN